MTDRLPDAEFLRNLAKDMGLELADQDELDRLNEIADGLEWRGIESAPKDSDFLAAETVTPWGCLPVERFVLCRWWSGDELNDPGWVDTATHYVFPHHWRPLPAQIPGCTTYFTGLASKLWYMAKREVKVDIWIDDDPKTLVHGH